MSSTSRTAAAFEMGLREYVRTPVLLALLGFLPAYFVYVVAQVVPDGEVPVPVGGATVTADLAGVFTTMMAPMAVALVAGIAGLFLMHSAREADSRLAVAGYRAHELVAARLGLLGLVALAATAITMGVVLVTFAPDHVWWFALATILVALTYGMVGVLAGIVLDRLPGVYLLLFGPSLDVFLLQNPIAADQHAIAGVTPSHFGMELAVAAAYGSPEVGEALGYGVGYLVALSMAAALALFWSLRVD